MPNPTSVAYELQLAGGGGAWTDVSADVRAAVPPHIHYGISGNGPLDLIASTGEYTFALNNAASNSAGLLGYYSPGHANCRAGFEIGIAARIKIVYGGVTYYKFRGILEDIVPIPGLYGQRLVACRVLDWMDETAKRPTREIATQVGQRADQIIATLRDSLTFQPAASSLAAASTEYPYSLDTARDGRTAVMSEMAKAVQSDLGQLYIKGDSVQGGTLRFADRRVRQNAGAALTTLTVQHGLTLGRKRRQLYNRVEVTVHPRRVDTAATTVLYSLDTGSLPSIAPGATITIHGSYSDPDLRASQVGGTDMATPVAGTDYAFGTSSTDTSLTASLGVVATYSSNSVIYALTNNAAVTGFVNLLQARGRGIYDYAPIMLMAEDAASKNAYGEYVLPIDLPHEVSATVGQAIANYYLSKYKDPRVVVDSVEIIGNYSDALMTAALAREPGDPVALTESVSGLSASRHVIQSVDLTLLPPHFVRCAWGLAPQIDTGSYWVLGTSLLGTGTRLAL